MSQSSLRWQFSSQSAPETADIQAVLKSNILAAMEAGGLGFRFPTAGGKSHVTNNIDWRTHSWVTNGNPVVHLQKSKVARDDGAQMAENNGLNHDTFISSRDACPVLNGREPPTSIGDGRTTKDVMLELVSDTGLSYSIAHSVAAELIDGELACQAGGTACPSSTQWDDGLRDENGGPRNDIVHACHPMVHVPEIRDETNLIFDEEPSTDENMGESRVRQLINARLRYEATEILSYARLIQKLRYAPESPHLTELRTALLDGDPDVEWYVETDGANRHDKAIIMALLNGEQRSCDQRFVGTARTRHWESHSPASIVTIMLDSEWSLRNIWNRPDLSAANSITCLDAWPDEYSWRLNLGFDPATDLFHDVIGKDDRIAWRQEKRGLEVIQVGESTVPLTSNPEYVPKQQVLALVEEIVTKHGRLDSVITSQAAMPVIKDIMDTAEMDVETMHYGDLESDNSFGGHHVGLVIGSMDAGDERIIDLLAYHDLDAKPERKVCPVCSDSSSPASACRTCNDDGEVRAHGRGFVGADAAEAEAMVETFRESHAAQAVGRWARNPYDSASEGAVVYAMTDVVPAELVDATIEAPDTRDDLDWSIIETVHENDGLSATQIRDQTGTELTAQAIRDRLNKMKDEGIIRKEGKTKGVSWHLNVPPDTVNPYGAVELTGRRFSKVSRTTDYYTAYFGKTQPGTHPSPHAEIGDEIRIERQQAAHKKYQKQLKAVREEVEGG